MMKKLGLLPVVLCSMTILALCAATNMKRSSNITGLQFGEADSQLSQEALSLNGVGNAAMCNRAPLHDRPHCLTLLATVLSRVHDISKMSTPPINVPKGVNAITAARLVCQQVNTTRQLDACADGKAFMHKMLLTIFGDGSAKSKEEDTGCADVLASYRLECVELMTDLSLRLKTLSTSSSPALPLPSTGSPLARAQAVCAHAVLNNAQRQHCVLMKASVMRLVQQLNSAESSSGSASGTGTGSGSDSGSGSGTGNSITPQISSRMHGSRKSDGSNSRRNGSNSSSTGDTSSSSSIGATGSSGRNFTTPTESRISSLVSALTGAPSSSPTAFHSANGSPMHTVTVGGVAGSRSARSGNSSSLSALCDAFRSQTVPLHTKCLELVSLFQRDMRRVMSAAHSNVQAPTSGSLLYRVRATCEQVTEVAVKVQCAIVINSFQNRLAKLSLMIPRSGSKSKM